MKEKQQLIHIHGGSPWKNTDLYIEYLKTKNVILIQFLNVNVGIIIIILF